MCSTLTVLVPPSEFVSLKGGNVLVCLCVPEAELYLVCSKSRVQQSQNPRSDWLNANEVRARTSWHRLHPKLSCICNEMAGLSF